MIKVETRPLEGFEDDYVRFTARRAVVESEVKAEFERVLAERTEKLDQLIALTSESVEVEYPDEDGEVIEENTETVE